MISCSFILIFTEDHPALGSRFIATSPSYQSDTCLTPGPPLLPSDIQPHWRAEILLANKSSPVPMMPPLSNIMDSLSQESWCDMKHNEFIRQCLCYPCLWHFLAFSAPWHYPSRVSPLSRWHVNTGGHVSLAGAYRSVTDPWYTVNIWCYNPV